MKENLGPKNWQGRLTKKILFVGSKSEREYINFVTSEHRFRVRLEEPTSVNLLEEWMDKDVCLEGVADDLRGHWRLTVSVDGIQRIAKIESEKINTNDINKINSEGCK